MKAARAKRRSPRRPPRHEGIDGRRAGMKRRHVRLDERHPGGRARRRHRRRVRGRGRQRLLAQDVLAREDGALHPRRDAGRSAAGRTRPRRRDRRAGPRSSDRRGDRRRREGRSRLWLATATSRALGLPTIAGITAFTATQEVAPITPHRSGAGSANVTSPRPRSPRVPPPSWLERWAASSTAITRRTDAGVTASGSPRCRWSARFRWNANGCPAAGGSRVSLIP